jgi:aminobenzoyl-glutamate utilization protein B
MELLFTALLIATAFGQQSSQHQQIKGLVDRHSARHVEISKTIWEYAEVGYQEVKSSVLLQRHLKEAGFRVEAGLADEPTAFVATYGQGKPVIGILGEFDALPGLSQAAVAARSPVTAGAPGHGCGHNLIGAGAALAAVALKEYMETNRVAGTLRFYGTPAEEGGSGKVYMVRAGLFRDVDAVLHWHPENHNAVINGGFLANTSARFRFRGAAAHGIESLREHVPSNARMHYIITSGGAAPNIVPDTAEIYLQARSPSLTALAGLLSRIRKIGDGAVLMTETVLDAKIIHSSANIVANDVLAKVAQVNLVGVGGFRYSADEERFGEQLLKSLPPEGAGDLRSTSTVRPLRIEDPNAPTASTDVGDVSWHVPTIGFFTATMVPGVVLHTWQATASAGMSIGQKGMVVAAKAMATTGADLFSNARLVADAKVEFQRQLQGKTYSSGIPLGQKPPLDYRKE